MKKFIYILVFTLTAIGCSTQRLDSEGHSYSDDITFRIIRVVSKKISEADMSRYTYIAKGGRYKVFTIEFKNNSSEDQIIDFDEFRLVDKNKKTYNVKLILDGFNSSFENFDKKEKKIKASKKKTFYVEFWPAFPKNEMPVLMVKNTPILFEKK